ncbi:hypothetical protein LguiB_000611 [Lonicera macranthoides]
MGSNKICMNENCGATNSIEWKRGWGLKSGGFASLCYSCGSAYQNLVFCEKFHLEESGWRECKYCGKRLHCGCVASKYLHHYLDFGGVGCLICVKDLETQSIRPNQHVPSDDLHNGFSTLSKINNQQASLVENGINGDTIDTRKLMQLGRTTEGNQPNHSPLSQNGDPSSLILQIKQEENMLTQPFTLPSIFSKPNGSIPIGIKDIYQSLVQPSSSFPVRPFPGGVVEGEEENKAPLFQEGQSSHISPKPPKLGPSVGPAEKKGKVSQTRVSRPPADGRGRNQLLPRYWPKITEQELQQLSGDLNSTIVPLFEKVLSASDAGRIGRLVLPKACAEAYFPPINQSEGLPIRIKDIKGKEWTFQFRFWTNNNSRMYVLEGVTPCLQHMQLQAGDTVTFSRIDPGGKFVMGFRKATSLVHVQDPQTSAALPNGTVSGETSFSGFNGNLPTDTFDWRKNGEHGGVKTEEHTESPLIMEKKKKKSRQIGSKSKRLHMHSEDAMELRVTWQEAQDMLRPSPRAIPTIVMIEDHEIEEYDEPPVFGKRTIFAEKETGEQEQWTQCDSCSKWRRLAADILLPPHWTCSDNISDPNRSSCSDPDEMHPNNLQSCFGANRDFKKRRMKEDNVDPEQEASGLDALATAAVLEDLGDSSVEPTTRHPRHRSGCSCIVCSQPPSGKGKHRPACVCNVCSTVRRRFKTLMMRKRKRQSERILERHDIGDAVLALDALVPSAVSGDTLRLPSEGPGGVKTEAGEMGNGVLDLNCYPKREDEVMVMVVEGTVGDGAGPVVPEAVVQLEMSFGQNGNPSFGSSLPSKAEGEIETEQGAAEERGNESLDANRENEGKEG